MSWVHLGLEERDAGLDNLDLSVEARDPMLFAITMRVYDSVRNEPRFQNIVRAFLAKTRSFVHQRLEIPGQ